MASYDPGMGLGIAIYPTCLRTDGRIVYMPYLRAAGGTLPRTVPWLAVRTEAASCAACRTSAAILARSLASLLSARAAVLPDPPDPPPPVPPVVPAAADAFPPVRELSPALWW